MKWNWRTSGTLAFAVTAGVLLLSAGAASATVGSPSGERAFGQSTVEPAYDDMSGQVVFILTPDHVADPVHSNNSSWAPLYIVVYPNGSTVGTLDCMGVPGNCPDHDGLVAGAAMGIMPSVYSVGVIGHDHLLANHATKGDFNIAWHVFIVLFTNSSFVNNHITTLSALTNASLAGQVIEVPTPIVFHCSVVPAVVYYHGTPVGTSP